MDPGWRKILTGKKLDKVKTARGRHGVISGSSSGALRGSLTCGGVECTNPSSFAEDKREFRREAGVNRERIIASSSRSPFHINEHSGDQAVSSPDGSVSDLQHPSTHCEAGESTCEPNVEGAPNPSGEGTECSLPGRENDWQIMTRCVRLNKMKCAYLPDWLISVQESYHANVRVSAMNEFRAAVDQAECLMKECSHDEWLLKAVELWECTEHFVEVLLDLCWSAYIMSLGVGNIEQSEKWRKVVEELLNSRRERNGVARLLYEDYHEIDKMDLDVKVCAKLRERNLVLHGPEHQLAHLLQDRLKHQALWQPPFLRRHSFFIYSNFVAPLRSSSKTGAHGAILKFPWVYDKKFAVKMRHPKEQNEKTFKREFDILDKYRSPFIVGVVGYWEVDSWSSRNPLTHTIISCPFLLMENLELDLKDLMDRAKTLHEGIRGGFPVLEAINLMLPIAKALRFLHGNDVAHRDVKPQNIMCRNVNVPEYPGDSIVKVDTIVKLIDFGEAMEYVPDLSFDEWRPAGTHGYMDPAMWKAEFDAVGYTLFMSDVFSFAMVFAELLTWTSPSEAFGVPHPRDAQAKLKAGERPSLPNGLPRYVQFIVESCWCADHLKRPDFKAICSMLQHAKMLLLDGMEFVANLQKIFSYEDATGGRCCISGET